MCVCALLKERVTERLREREVEREAAMTLMGGCESVLLHVLSLAFCSHIVSLERPVDPPLITTRLPLIPCLSAALKEPVIGDDK